MHYTVRTNTPTTRNIYAEGDELVATFVRGAAGAIVFGMFVETAARRGCTVYDDDTGEYLAGSVGDLVP